ncbi:MAG: amino acid adenylation domain-containing protein [Leptolyngbya sp. SIO4C5]|nr:amino acid adenylation domain-containing protein [Leptolyngbya sp. SIO4C5]
MQSQKIEGFRLSPLQRHLWRLQQTESGQPYRVQAAIMISGKLNLIALRSALQTLVKRHEILRTTFQLLPGMTTPLQVIQTSELFSLCEHDLTSFSVHEQEAEGERLFEQLKQQPFSPKQKPPLAAHLLRLSADSQILLVSLSALIADSTTLSQMVSQLSQLYADSLPAEMPEETGLMQYADVAEWQNELLEQVESGSGQAYWSRQAVDRGDRLDLSFLKQPQAKEPSAFRAESVSIALGPDLLTQIHSLSRKLDIAPADLLLAGWQILLWRIAGRRSPLTIRVASDGRRYEELAQTLGLLSKYLPVSSRLESTDSFTQTAKQLSEQLSDARQWQDAFVPEGADTDSQADALNSVGFEFDAWPQTFTEAGLVWTLERRYACTERLGLNLSCWPQGERLIADFYYDAGRYDAPAIAELATSYGALLQAATDSPQLALGQLSLLSDRQRQFLVAELNQTAASYPPAQSIQVLFAAQAAQTPGAPAVIFEDQSLTYAELNGKANQLAHYLRSLGVGPETVVGIYLERSLALIISLLAVLKAGGAYLPLDPATPEESLAFRLQDAQAPVVISQGSLAAKLAAIESQVICLESQEEAIAQASQAQPEIEVQPEHLAYVLFTSGSTGQPKGVAVEHQQLVHYVRAIAERLDLNTCQSFATVSTFAADLGNTVIFPALVSGGCLHVISAERAANPEALVDYFSRHPVDCLKIVPSHLAALLTASQPKQILPRRRLILGGEACPRSLVTQIQSYKTGCQIVNHYGPTETTVGVLTQAIEAHSEEANIPETLPLGRPLANTQIYLLDAEQQPVPLGVPGEIYIGGAGVARSYLNRPALTAERFIPNPIFSQAPSAAHQASKVPRSVPRLYRTGDLGRYQADGTVEFLGRVDQQVKIRGYRIELGEIEVALQQHPEVRANAVQVYEAQPGNQRLVAYVVPQNQAACQTGELRQWLQSKLPDYMVPATFVLLKSLPLTPNGKLDRRALPDPSTAPLERSQAFVAPQTESEKTLAQIWAQSLKLEKIGIHDNFFELGGDSILSIQIVARANQAGLHLTPKQVFENQTVAELAAVATARQAIQAEQGLVLGSVPLTPIQRWFFQQALPEAHHWNQSILLDVPSPLNLAQLEPALQTLLRHHDALRLRFVQAETGWQAFVAEPEATVPFTQIDLSDLEAAEQTAALAAAATKLQASLNLTSGPLMRAAYFKRGGHGDRLLLIIHHLVVDGVSWRILLEDWQLAHHQLSQGQPLQLPPKTTSFQYWATQLTEYARSAALQSEIAYWQQQLSQPVTPIPVDFPSGENTVAQASTVSVALSAAETLALLQEVPAAYRTQINDALLTALVQTFAQWTGKSTLLVDLEGHGREDLFEDVNLSRTVGWFTTIFPLRLAIAEAADPGAALRAIKEQLRSVPNRGIGYGLLRYLSLDNGSLESQSASAQVRVNYLGQTDQVLQPSSLFTVASEPRGPGRSPKGDRRYDLDINAVVAGGQLRADWSYSQARYRAETITALADGFITALRSLIAHCQSPDAGGYTPSDFAEANLNQQELDQFLAKITGQSS